MSLRNRHDPTQFEARNQPKRLLRECFPPHANAGRSRATREPRALHSLPTSPSGARTLGLARAEDAFPCSNVVWAIPSSLVVPRATRTRVPGTKPRHPRVARLQRALRAPGRDQIESATCFSTFAPRQSSLPQSSQTGPPSQMADQWGRVASHDPRACARLRCARRAGAPRTIAGLGFGRVRLTPD